MGNPKIAHHSHNHYDGHGVDGKDDEAATKATATDAMMIMMTMMATMKPRMMLMLHSSAPLFGMAFRSGGGCGDGGGSVSQGAAFKSRRVCYYAKSLVYLLSLGCRPAGQPNTQAGQFYPTVRQPAS